MYCFICFVGEIVYMIKWYFITVLEDTIQQKKAGTLEQPVKAELIVLNFNLKASLQKVGT